jgi:hypothetical protein
MKTQAQDTDPVPDVLIRIRNTTLTDYLLESHRKCSTYKLNKKGLLLMHLRFHFCTE